MKRTEEREGAPAASRSAAEVQSRTSDSFPVRPPVFVKLGRKVQSRLDPLRRRLKVKNRRKPLYLTDVFCFHPERGQRNRKTTHFLFPSREKHQGTDLDFEFGIKDQNGKLENDQFVFLVRLWLLETINIS